METSVTRIHVFMGSVWICYRITPAPATLDLKGDDVTYVRLLLS